MIDLSEIIFDSSIIYGLLLASKLYAFLYKNANKVCYEENSENFGGFDYIKNHLLTSIAQFALHNNTDYKLILQRRFLS